MNNLLDKMLCKGIVRIYLKTIKKCTSFLHLSDRNVFVVTIIIRCTPSFQCCNNNFDIQFIPCYRIWCSSGSVFCYFDRQNILLTPHLKLISVHFVVFCLFVLFMSFLSFFLIVCYYATVKFSTKQNPELKLGLIL